MDWLNVPCNPEAKEQLDRFDGLIPRNSETGRDNPGGVAILAREVTTEKQNEKEEPHYIEPNAFQEVINHPDPK